METNIKELYAYNNMEFEAEVKEWGNSLGIILPKISTKKENIKAGDKVKITLSHNNNVLRETFGSLPDWKIDSQKAKDAIRKEWSKR